MARTVLLARSPLPYPEPSTRFLLEAWWTCHSSTRHTWRNRCDCLLATGQPLSVVPPAIRDGLDLVIYPARGWKGAVPTWFGIPCRIGRAEVWLAVQEDQGLRQPFSILVLLPQQDLEDAAPFVYLGAQFLVEHKVRVLLEGSAGGSDRLVFP
jgi:hypothetical protein